MHMNRRVRKPTPDVADTVVIEITIAGRTQVVTVVNAAYRAAIAAAGKLEES